MKTSQQWFDYFESNLKNERIDWSRLPSITLAELKPILKSLQAWQLGETSEGNNLIKASSKYALAIDDLSYIKAVRLFIKEEQKHGNNLGKYLDLLGKPRLQRNWGDSLFRFIRYFNTSIEMWTLAVITVESAAQIFYQCLHDASNCSLLKEICTDILIDEKEHICFQQERFEMIFRSKKIWSKYLSYYFYRWFFATTSLVVWFAHRKAFEAGGIDFKKYLQKMFYKYRRTIGILKHRVLIPVAWQPSQLI